MGPTLLILSWLLRRFGTRSRYVPTWFFRIWLAVVIASGVTAAIIFATTPSNPGPDLSRGILLVLLIVNSSVTAFTLVVLYVLPRGRPQLDALTTDRPKPLPD